MESHEKILVIDDDEEYLAYVATVIQDAQLPFNLASSAYVAKKIITEDRPPLILTDLRLPGSSGLDILKSALALDPTIVVIVMTAFGSVDSALECLKNGAYDYLLKPSSPDEISAALKRAVGHRRIRTELVRKTTELETFKKNYAYTDKMIEGYTDVLAPLARRSDIPVDVRAKLEHLRLRIKRRQIPEQ
ncbi:MAG: hypothetical protein COB53_02390 [Elusimicrobia bacterium]|nr:MAG: hypothetical protein COB53_02390 [Elusimicrobiota bacterium]